MSNLDPNLTTENEQPVSEAAPAPTAPIYQQPYQQPINQNPYSATNPGYSQNPYSPQPPYYASPAYAPVPARKKGLSVGGIIAIILACSLVCGALGFFGSYFITNHGQSSSTASPQETPSAPSTPSTPAAPAPSSQENGSQSLVTIQEAEPMTLTVAPSQTEVMSIPDVVDKTADSVVEITTEIVATSMYMQQYITSGAGSGIVISDNGYVLTNNHVISDATSVTVTLHNGESYPAVLVGLDEDLDIALLKIEAEDLTPATIGTSSDLRVGQTIIAIGNPLGQLGGTVTSGIISALERSITIDGTTMSLMQIDAAINPGNSGGALFDEKGTLVGVVNAKSSGSGVEGIGFAIPIDSVVQVLDDLVNYGYVKGRPAIGITMVDITNSQMAYMYRVNELGPYVYSVNEGGAAEKAGLQSGDRIVSINGVAVSTAAEVKAQIATVAVGESFEMEVSRSGQTITINLVMGEYIPALIKDRTSTH